MQSSTYAIALGSNRRGRHGGPVAEVRAAIAALEGVVAVSPIIASAPLGPSIRRFANAAVLLESPLAPPAMLARLKAIERAFGRRRGARWGARVIDLDIVLWSGGSWGTAALTVPHIAFRERGFVLDPLRTIAPDWRDPVTGLSIRQLHARLHKRAPLG
ncbi:2-amino-4-hydroxy-6-hydroxymethyldihydropteridine diphosphokinase [Sphingomonas echinoides]|uniref:2-amino-4-hydroxy-6-hydroxymethyldihydropteridine pyrophosphokinase n=1 Tax=Sphingomonas echinoides TaxID=59803 RepID=A0ABU4PET2_9SPHN|nr:2-amino-4-hydroxy-6-hydroxymethyldihydropteridine diphosphokinase [Sphingomonas echinoides]MDX5982731.1 2-amino-4-hydroxy-6-hydroxymethyldihydropteridine diphosphokinase [Sphingomonas echinoides]